MKKRWLLLVVVFALGILAACGGDEESSSENKNTEPQMGGTLTGAMDTAPTGQFNPIFYQEAYEANILDFTHEGLVSQNNKLEFIPNLAKDWEFNEDHTELTFHLQENVKWHDGEPFTADDVVFTYKMISSPGYVEAGGVRTDYVERLLGYEEFSTGKTKEFKGVEKIDDHTVKFRFSEPNVIALSDASFPIIPEHVFKDIPIDKMPSAPESKEPGKVIGTGPFRFTEMVEGEQYVLEKNPDYWQGEPYLDKIVWKVMDQSVILGALKNKEIDFVADPNGVPAADFQLVSEMKHVKVIEQQDFGYQIMGFIHNYRKPGDKSINPDNWIPNEKLKDQKVRQAIAYAVNRQGLIDGLLHGKGSVINSPIAPQFFAYDGEKPNQYPYDPEKAKQLLDEAGYKDVDGDGFREDPNGNKWVLSLHYPSGNQIRERSAPIIEKDLEKVGINIDLKQPMEMSAYVDALTNADEDWDLYLLGWSLSSADPDPTGLWSARAAYNFGRWNKPEADQLLKDALKPPEAFEQDYRKQIYSDWQVKFQEDLPALLLYAQNKIYAFNKRLHNVDPLPYAFINDPHKWWVDQ